MPIIWRHILIQLPRCFFCQAQQRVSRLRTSTRRAYVKKITIAKFFGTRAAAGGRRGQLFITNELWDNEGEERVAEPCCTIVTVKTCLQFNRGYLHRLENKVNMRLVFTSWFHPFSRCIDAFCHQEFHWKPKVYKDLSCSLRMWSSDVQLLCVCACAFVFFFKANVFYVVLFWTFSHGLSALWQKIACDDQTDTLSRGSEFPSVAGPRPCLVFWEFLNFSVAMTFIPRKTMQSV